MKTIIIATLLILTGCSPKPPGHCPQCGNTFINCVNGNTGETRIGCFKCGWKYKE